MNNFKNNTTNINKPANPVDQYQVDPYFALIALNASLSTQNQNERKKDGVASPQP